MSNLAPLAIIYFQLTLFAACILLLSFWKKFDTSALLFLAAEFSSMFTAVMLGYINVVPVNNPSIELGIANFFAINSEIFVYFGLRSLTQNISKKFCVILVVFSGMFSIFVQVVRLNFGPNIALILQAIPAILIIAFTLKLFLKKQASTPSSNIFFQWIGWFEFGLLIVWLIRFLSGFFPAPMVPTNPTILAVIVFSAHIVFTSFRYLSYIGLRTTMILGNPESPNKLNLALTKIFVEKNELFRGLISSNRAIGISALASSLAHQLSQPLTAIAFQAASASRQAEKIPGHPDLMISLNAISSEAEKLADLVGNLSGLFSQQHHTPEVVNLGSISNEILELTEPTLISKKIDLKVRVLKSPSVIADPIQLQQVLINLLNNAVDAIELANPAKRQIILTINLIDKFATLSIQDTGYGVPIELQEQIFDLYKTSKKSGLGVGLWLCKKIISIYHGTIDVENSQSGGAIFTIKIPAILNQEQTG